MQMKKERKRKGCRKRKGGGNYRILESLKNMYFRFTKESNGILSSMNRVLSKFKKYIYEQ